MLPPLEDFSDIHSITQSPIPTKLMSLSLHMIPGYSISATPLFLFAHISPVLHVRMSISLQHHGLSVIFPFLNPYMPTTDLDVIVN